MKKFAVLLFSFFMIAPIALASETYVTQNGVSMNKSDYERLCEIYTKAYVESLTATEYENLMSDNLEHVEKVVYEPTRGDFFSDSAKSILLVKNGSWVTLTAYWTGTPSVNSYDVIAVRLSGVSLVGNFSFKQIYKNGGTYYTVYNGNNQTFYNGFGSSALLQSGSNQEYSLTFKTSGTGTVYGSYQHAMSNVTLVQSKNYTISSTGYGGVINFASSVSSYYDAMPGVYMSI